MSKPIRVGVTGAAGQICYSLLFRIAAGEMFGPNQKVDLVLKEVTPALKATEGVAMELDDCAFPLLNSITITDSDATLCDGVEQLLLVGAAPRKQGMERGDLIKVNGPIFKSVGHALNNAAKSVQILVVGNPCNTNALIAMNNCDLPKDRFHAMMALDENRMKGQLAKKAGVPVASITKTAVWGNHSAVQFPDFHHAEINGKPVTNVISDQNWLETTFISKVQKRGAEIIEARGLSSAASAANAAIDHVRNMRTPTKAGQWFTAAVVSNGEYGVPKGLIFGFPVTSNGERWSIVDGLLLNDFAKAQLKRNIEELESERVVVADLLKS